MRAITFQGTGKVQVDNVDDPTIEDQGDVVLKVTSTAICGSDLHLYDGFIPEMRKGDILGHEFMGEIVAVGSGVTRFKQGDRVLVPFNIACGQCDFCRVDAFALCDNTNPDHEKVDALYGQSPGGMFGYSHLFGGYAGGQAEYVRVPHADVGLVAVPESLPDEKVLFLTDIFPTGYQAVEQVGTGPGDLVAIWGAGPVGQFAIRSAFMLGAERVFALDFEEGRLDMARKAGAETINLSKEDSYERLLDLTGGKLPNRCIDAVGLEAHGASVIGNIYDKAKAAMMLETDRPNALRDAIMCCRKGGAVSIPGVYAGVADKFPIGAAFGKGLMMRGGQTHTRAYMERLLKRVEAGEIDPSTIITHRGTLEDGPGFYENFRDKRSEYIKCVMTP
ncbi:MULTISPECIES: zinc-dependent alcohol dehydrogenase [unclassified Paracoccus (in: a-proteobacteria)]|uniref:zinc-dependent alcohol dehydrogenase n=1 Tax=unclassified Paracoccus (in: a-proteobacteria) TaxID=2688777 RepID=UPI0015FF7B43|nr:MULTISPECIES: zinc-dependent alcohol dehydrogenase [unclassified Paracoccus (in: a-proteobacteria)]MBB1490458.1 glutathione-dependent formaldehyde dehydrogenase [Paracoccus sp. MC1854]MBB1497301.1 glutathione-dependent formaldehyde dehydrogenase [Paracoccus sp. MC1862]QQO44733.1 glutathione-dependent formaldehyde dehydrogenase [Paracoccus sp. MC1862]